MQTPELCSKHSAVVCSKFIHQVSNFTVLAYLCPNQVASFMINLLLEESLYSPF